MEPFNHKYLSDLEDESIYIFREVAASASNPIILYSIGKDSSVLLHLAKKAFFPGKIPFSLLHIDTGFKFPEMISFRDKIAAKHGVEVLVYRNESAIRDNTNPTQLGTQRCCGLLKTKALLDGLNLYKVDAAIGGARRDEEKSRAKERFFSFRDKYGQWDPKNQRPELWDLYNTKLNPQESLRVFPLSNWTELDIWTYIRQEKIEIVPLYFAQKRLVIRKADQLVPVLEKYNNIAEAELVNCRYRSLGCYPCTGAVESSADSLDKIVASTSSERVTRLIDHDGEASMELKKREGYF